MENEEFKPIRLDLNIALNEAMNLPGFKEAWNAFEEEYTTLSELFRARKQAGLTQEEIAQRMGTTKSAVSRLEASFRSEKDSPSLATLRKYAHVCGKKLVIKLM